MSLGEDVAGLSRPIPTHPACVTCDHLSQIPLTSVGSCSLSIHPFPLPPLFSCPVIWSDVFQFPNDSSTLNWLEEPHSGTYARKSDFPMFVHSKRRSRQRLSMPVFSLVARSSQEPISHRPRPVQPLSLFSRPSSWPFIPLGLQSLFVSCAPSPKQKKKYYSC